MRPKGACSRPGKKYERQKSKPPYTYMGMMIAAIWYSPHRCLSLSDIQKSLEEMFSFFTDSSYQGWRDSIRHTLSRHACFVKVLRDPNQPERKCNLWTVDVGSIPDNVFVLQTHSESAKMAHYPKDLLTYLRKPALNSTNEQSMFTSAVSLYSLSTGDNKEQSGAQARNQSNSSTIHHSSGQTKNKPTSSGTGKRSSTTTTSDQSKRRKPTKMTSPDVVITSYKASRKRKSESSSQNESTDPTVKREKLNPLPSSCANNSPTESTPLLLDNDLLSSDVKLLIDQIYEDYRRQFSESSNIFHEMEGSSSSGSVKNNVGHKRPKAKKPSSRRRLDFDSMPATDNSDENTSSQHYSNSSQSSAEPNTYRTINASTWKTISTNTDYSGYLDTQFMLYNYPHVSQTRTDFMTNQTFVELQPMHFTSHCSNPPQFPMYVQKTQPSQDVMFSSTPADPVHDFITSPFTSLPLWDETGSPIDAHDLIPIDNAELPELPVESILSAL